MPLFKLTEQRRVFSLINPFPCFLSIHDRGRLRLRQTPAVVRKRVTRLARLPPSPGPPAPPGTTSVPGDPT